MVSESGPLGEFTGEELYLIVRKAVEDAIISAIGTLILVVLAFGLIWFGMLIGVQGFGGNPLQAAGGGFLVLVGLYFAGTSLDLIPTLDAVLSSRS